MILTLLNPNTNEATTAAMLAVAREAAPAGVTLRGVTARRGAPLITDEAALRVAAEAVLEWAEAGAFEGADGVIVAAFGDPGLDALRARLPVPVTGIAEAGMAEAAGHGAFAVVTTTPDLAAAIERTALRYGHAEAWRGVRVTPGDPRALMAEPDRLADALERLAREAAAEGARAVVVGGGPLALAARAIRARLPVPVIEPVPAAVRLAADRAAQTPSR